MPGSETQEEQRGERLLPVLFWAGVGLAPVAALLLLIGSGDTSLRAAVGVITLSVILIGLSITLRRDTETMRIEIEDTMLDEIDAVRADIRADIATAAHATHRAFGEKLQFLAEQLEATRGELDMARAQLEAVRAETSRHPMSPAAGPPVRHGPTPSQAMPLQQPAPNRAAMPPGVPPGGVVRHTETVQVTTRHTVVDPHGEEASRGTTYGRPGTGFERGAPRKEAPEFAQRLDVQRPPRAERDREESWTEQRLREQLERRRDAAEPVSADRWQSRGDSGWTERGEPDRRPERGAERGADRGTDRGAERGTERGGERGADRALERGEPDRWSDGADGDRRPGIRSGDRWATVRTDDRGQEVRMGERRAAMHTDQSGTELRIEDRWAAVRHEDARGSRSWHETDEDEELDEDGRPAFPWREPTRREPERPAITSGEREERWPPEYDDDDDRGRGRRYR